MIEPSELRIGNVVQVGGVVAMIMGADLHLAQDMGEPVPAEPIDITEEHIEVINRALPGYTLPGHIKYVHQLQNYFHALTGRELPLAYDLPGFSNN